MVAKTPPSRVRRRVKETLSLVGTERRLTIVRSMRTIDSTLVDIARDFLEAHQALRALAARHRSGELHFDEVLALVESNGDGMIMNIQRGDRELYILLK